MARRPLAVCPVASSASRERLVALFDRHPRAYDLQLPLERRALRVAAALAGPLAGARVVDLAAGTGALSAAILARGAPPASLTLVDGSPRMLERARARLRRVAGSPAFLVADARAVPLGDGAADVVAIGYLLHLLEPDPREAVLREARRLLIAGGLLVAVVLTSPGGLAGRLYRGIWRALGRLLPTLGGGPVDDLAAALASAGFVVEASRRVHGVYWSQVVRARRPGPAATASGHRRRRRGSVAGVREDSQDPGREDGWRGPMARDESTATRSSSS